MNFNSQPKPSCDLMILWSRVSIDAGAISGASSSFWDAALLTHIQELHTGRTDAKSGWGKRDMDEWKGSSALVQTSLSSWDFIPDHYTLNQAQQKSALPSCSCRPGQRCCTLFRRININQHHRQLISTVITDLNLSTAFATSYFLAKTPKPKFLWEMQTQ